LDIGDAGEVNRHRISREDGRTGNGADTTGHGGISAYDVLA
jgi:hypothetical protein